jgi:hypothetical protein
MFGPTIKIMQRNIVLRNRLEKMARDCEVKYVLWRLVVMEVLETNPSGNPPNILRTMDAIYYLHRVWKSICLDQDFPSLSIIYFTQFRDRIVFRYLTETATVFIAAIFQEYRPVTLWPALHYQFLTRVSVRIVNYVYHCNSVINIFHSSNQMYAICYVNVQEFYFFQNMHTCIYIRSFKSGQVFGGV